MSFEGSKEYLCEKGHYQIMDVYYCDKEKCSICNSPFVYFHLIDETNGYEEDNPSTYQAEKKEVGFDDIWKEDHYGNKYAIKIYKYEPSVGSEWRKYNPDKDRINPIEYV